MNAAVGLLAVARQMSSLAARTAMIARTLGRRMARALALGALLLLAAVVAHFESNFCSDLKHHFW